MNKSVNSSYIELIMIIVLSLIAGFIAKIPTIFNIDENIYFLRNISFIVLPFMAIYFQYKSCLKLSRIIPITVIFILSIIYLNLLPGNNTTHTLILSAIHLPVFLWFLLGYIYVKGEFKDVEKVIAFLKFNADLLVISAIIVIAGLIFSLLTVGLFSLIDMDIENFYFGNIAIWGISAVPIVGGYLIFNNRQLVKGVSPIIAKVFTPLVLIMLVIYLIAIIYSGNSVYKDRDFLTLFNVMLIAVMALILFSISQVEGKSLSKWFSVILLMLIAITVIVNSVALSAIIYRISEWGVSVNRVAILGGNVLILINLILVFIRLIRYLVDNKIEETSILSVIVNYIPLYAVWCAIVSFIFPLIF